MKGGPFSAKADHVCSQEGTFGLFFFFSKKFFVLFFCNRCLNGKIIMVKYKSRVYYSLRRSLCYITTEHPIKQNVVVSEALSVLRPLQCIGFLSEVTHGEAQGVA